MEIDTKIINGEVDVVENVLGKREESLGIR